jgi:hypothetical protein
VERVWGAAGFEIESWVPNGQLFDQAMVVLVRSDSPIIVRPIRQRHRNVVVRAVRKGGRIISRFGD